MLMRQITALTVAVALAFLAGPLAFAQQAQGQIAGSAKDEAKKPYTDYEVRARAVANGAIAATAQLDQTAKFVLRDLKAEKYLVELVKKNKVVCSEGPFGLTPEAPSKLNVNIKCGLNTATYVLAAAAAAGIAAAITRNPASPAQ
ncbi:MAG: hypothetical protein ACM3NQ_19460 [Bacteroidales bacterium]